MFVIYECEIWRAAIKPENFGILKEESPNFRVWIEKNGKGKTAPLSDMEIPVYSSDVKARINVGWEVLSYTEHSIVLGNGTSRMVYDKDKKIFSKPYEVYE